MLKTRTSIQLGVGLIVLLFIAFIAVLAWPTAPPSAESIAKRGLEVPEERSSGFAQDWFDQGWDAFARWDKNPLGIHQKHFAQHLFDLSRSKDPKDQAEYQRLLELARKWHENLLSRYPELRVTYRDVPDDRNALKLLFDLQKRLTNEDGSSSLSMPKDIRDKLIHPKLWDPKAAQAWLDANRAMVEEFRTICLMPESSIKDFGALGFRNFIWDGQRALLLDARLAAERGDSGASMESIRATVALANHVLESEAPYLSLGMAAGNMLESTRTAVFESILPNIPAGQIDLAAWETLLKPTIQSPADFARTMRGQWNGMMQYQILPALADPGASQVPADAEQFTEAYTSYSSHTVETIAPLALTELPSQSSLTLDTSGLSWRSRQLLVGMTDGNYYRNSWERQQINTGLTQAAFAILKGQPVPNDPIYGQPYQWNPETRELSLPKGPEFSNMRDSGLKLPKL